MSNPVGTLTRGESRKLRTPADAGQFDPARLLRLGVEGSLRSVHAAAEVAEESLVTDCRASVRPAQAVERKLMRLLEGKAMSVSQLRTASFSSRSRAVFD
jgi:hypothetical protein